MKLDISDTKLLIGCPIRDRAWILPQWKHYVDMSCSVAGIIPSFIFVLGEDDESSIEIVRDWPNTTIQLISEPVRSDVRDWLEPRLRHMVEIRNILLERVRDLTPDYFLSLDSDILLNEMTVINLLEKIETYGPKALGSKTYLSETGHQFTNMGIWANKRKSQLFRDDSTYIRRVDVLMAIKLMTPEAYNVDYVYSPLGEDIGWSGEVQALYSSDSLMWDGSITNKHVMHRDLLDVVDPRIGW